MRVGITGGTGFLGGRLAARLRARGDVPVVFSRRARELPGSEVRVWSGREPLDPAAVADLEAVVHLAGAPLVAGRWTEERKRLLIASRVKTTTNLIARWSELDRPPRVLLSGSAIGFYGDRGDERLDEGSSSGSDFLAELCARWEAAAAPAAELGTRVALLRTGLVLARGEGLLGKMLLPFRLGLGGRLGSGRQWMSWIHEADWVDLALFALDTAGVSGPVNLTAPGAVRNADFTKVLAGVLRRPAWLPVPEFALRLLFGEMSEAMLGSQRVGPKLGVEAGFSFRFGALEPALRDLTSSD